MMTAKCLLSVLTGVHTFISPGYLSTRPLALAGYGSIATHEAKPYGLLNFSIYTLSDLGVSSVSLANEHYSPLLGTVRQECLHIFIVYYIFSSIIFKLITTLIYKQTAIGFPEC